MSYVIYIVIFFIVMYYIAIRPVNKQNKEHQKILESLKIGNIIVTNGGIIGKITLINDKTINIESLNSEMKIDKRSIIKIEKEEQ